MNRDINITASGAPYEYTVMQKRTAALAFRKISLIALYVLWTIGLLTVGAMSRLIAPLLAFIPFSLWLLVFLTWRYTQVEYEYSFFSGTLTVSRVLGGRARKELCRVAIRSVSEILPYEDAYVDRIERFSAERTVFAASDENAQNLYAVLWTDGNNVRTVLFFEASEKALKICRYYNMSAMARKN